MIGAGAAGFACAAALDARGLGVVVIDKGRGVGGRASSKRLDPREVGPGGPGGPGAADLGAQYLTARSDAMRARLDRLARTGAAAVWPARVVQIDARGERTPEPPRTDDDARWVGVPSMGAMMRSLWGTASDRVSIRVGIELAPLVGERGPWSLVDTAGEPIGTFDRVVVTTPAPQAARLLATASPELASRLTQAELAPCIAALLELDPSFDPGFDAARLEGDPVAWLARESSKPGRAPSGLWVAHASESFSRAHVDAPPERVAEALAAHVATTLHAQSPRVALAHRWRYARVVRTLAGDGGSFLIHPEHGLAVAGDAFAGARLEGAFESGRQLGEALADALGGARGAPDRSP